MSGFAATSGKFEVFAPGDDTHVMFNDNNDIMQYLHLHLQKVLKHYNLKSAEHLMVLRQQFHQCLGDDDLGMYHNGSIMRIILVT